MSGVWAGRWLACRWENLKCGRVRRSQCLSRFVEYSIRSGRDMPWEMAGRSMGGACGGGRR
jgi:hypothetical protein